MPSLDVDLRKAASLLSDISGTARLDAEILMAHALGLERADMLSRRNDLRTPSNFESLVARRAASEPIAYIVGNQDFWDLTLKVTPDVLIPRPDSETIIDWICGNYKATQSLQILDLGTGSGALLLAALSAFSNAKGIGIDNSNAAVEVAMHNAAQNGLAERCEFLCADWTQLGWMNAIKGPFDLILSNPPYIGENETLMTDVIKFEPATALFAGNDGLKDYKILIPQLEGLLAKDGKVLLEIGSKQAQPVSNIAEQEGYLTTIKQDLAGLDRVLLLEQNMIS